MERLIFIIIFLFSSNFLFSENIYIIKALFSPRDFYVGDLVTLNVHIEPPLTGDLLPPEAIPNEEWIDIKSIILIPNGQNEVIVRISFTSFAPGLRLLPEIKLGQHVLKDVKIQTLSILDDTNNELQSLAPQATPKGTTLFLVLSIFALVFGPYVLILIIKGMFITFRLAIEQYKREKPYRDYNKVLRRLRDNLENEEVKDFYVVIIEELKIYLAKRFNKEFFSATTLEMKPLLLTIMDKDSTAELISICRFADLVKFNQLGASALHRKKDLRGIVEIVTILERKDVKFVRS